MRTWGRLTPGAPRPALAADAGIATDSGPSRMSFLDTVLLGFLIFGGGEASQPRPPGDVHNDDQVFIRFLGGGAPPRPPLPDP